MAGPVDPPPTDVVVGPIGTPRSASLAPIATMQPFAMTVVPGVTIGTLIEGGDSGHGSFSNGEWQEGGIPTRVGVGAPTTVLRTAERGRAPKGRGVECAGPLGGAKGVGVPKGRHGTQWTREMHFLANPMMDA